MLSISTLELPDDPNGQQAGISTGCIEPFIFATHAKRSYCYLHPSAARKAHVCTPFGFWTG
jgi:hypothetical protein